MSYTIQEAKDEVAKKYGYTSWDWIIAEYPINTRCDRTTEEMVEEAWELYSSKQREEDQKRIEELKRLLTATVYIIETIKSGKIPIDIDEGIAYYKDQALNL